MNRLLTLALAFAAGATLVAADFADARRMSGGRSLGAQRTAPAQQATPPSAAPAPAQAAPSGAAANPVMPRQGAAQPGAAAKAAPGAAAAAPKSGLGRWMGPLAGLAAGLGLAALASYLGIADELLSALLIAGMVLIAIVAIRAILARRNASQGPIRYAGATAGTTANAPRDYAPPPPPAATPVSAAVQPRRNVPPGFDAERFLLEAKHQFTRLQDAHDRGDRDALADVMTPALFAQIVAGMPSSRGAHPTEIVALNPELIEVVTDGGEHWASVHFRGLVREDGEPMPRPLDEVWHLVKPVDGKSGWLLAGIQQGEPAAGHA
jgi:predicted lipid-binding transport protein (Tim44 family)